MFCVFLISPSTTMPLALSLSVCWIHPLIPLLSLSSPPYRSRPFLSILLSLFSFPRSSSPCGLRTGSLLTGLFFNVAVIRFLFIKKLFMCSSLRRGVCACRTVYHSPTVALTTEHHSKLLVGPCWLTYSPLGNHLFILENNH